jgi:molecular chaperone HscB
MDSRPKHSGRSDGRSLSAGVGGDHFAVLGLRRAFHIDPVLLAERHLALSRELHPDRFAQRSPRERLLSLQRTTAINDAYRTLRDPVRRAEYILRLAGVSTEDRDRPRGLGAVGSDPEFLEEIMRIRERMMEASLDGGRGHASPEGQAILAEAETKIREIDQAIDRRFTEWEADPESESAGQALQAIHRCLARRRYYANIVAEIEGDGVAASYG